MRSDENLMDLHLQALYLHDKRDRLTAINDVDRGVAPRFHLGRTVEGNTWRFRQDLADGLVAELESILADEPTGGDLAERATTFGRLSAALSRSEPVQSVWEGPAWHFAESIATPPGIETVMVGPGMTFIGDRFTWLVDELEDIQPAFVVLDGDRIASLCHSSRNTPAAAEAGVETLEGYRSRGYATAVVAAWAREVRRQGREPLYSTSWDNHASRALARRLGLILYGADLYIT